MLPKQAYEEFNNIHNKQFGFKLSEEECIKKANDFLDLYKHIDKQRLTPNKENS